jgi:hypothetical protein
MATTPEVLTQAELECLLEVKTTVDQAKTIIRRNRLALQLLHAGENGEVRVRCPHCIGLCFGCAYSKTEFAKETSGHATCLYYSFGGVTAEDVTEVIGLFSTRMQVGASVDVPWADPDEIKRQTRAAIRWAEGHIEWAKEVLRQAKRRKKGYGRGCPYRK